MVIRQKKTKRSTGMNGSRFNNNKSLERRSQKIKKRDYITSPEYARRFLLNRNSPFAAMEAYRAARTNLLFTRVGEGCQSIVITSTDLSEGKSISCANLALSMANNKKKVLIIDADLRCPVMHRIFNISNEIGLSEYLAGFQKADKPGDHALIVKSRYDNLSILPAGHIPPNPAELLASRRMSNLLETLSKTFDYILIDTPPIAIMTDAAVLSAAVQGYILVVRAGKTPLGALQNVVLHLQQLGANLLGFLLNDLNVKTGSYKYSRYSKYSTRGRYDKNYIKNTI